MRVGILTFHNAHNYGAVLQAYALQTKLKELGYDVSIINYCPHYIEDKYKLFFKKNNHLNTFKKIKVNLGLLYTMRRKIKRISCFKKFSKNNLLLTTKLNPKTLKLIEQFDCLVLGSDQIWNPLLTDGYDPFYFGCIEGCNFQGRVVSYAASMEFDKIYDEQKLISLISKVNAIGVRESGLKKVLETVVNKNIEVNIDPTFLLTSEEWDKISAQVEINEPYLLIYENLTSKKTFEIADKIALKLGLKIKVITVDISWRDKKHFLSTASPEEFISYFKNAAFVLTTSFHGTAFSIIYNKPFITLRLNQGADKRSESLLKMLNLSSRFLEPDKFNLLNDIDYYYVNDILNTERNKAITFLRENIK